MPTPSEVKQFIEKIPELVAKLTYEDVVKLCNLNFQQIPSITIDFTNEASFFGQYQYGGTNVIYRGRKLENNQDVPFQNISDISYIKEKEVYKIKNFGRVNKKEESMFYGALNPATACIETITKGVDFLNSGSAMVVVGMWKLNSPLKLVEMPFSEKYWKLFMTETKIEPDIITENLIKKRNDDIKLKIDNGLLYEILTLFSDAFANFKIRSDSDYYLSNYFADRIFNRIPGFNCEDIDGIIYPSVPHSYQEQNIVLKPEVVKNKLKFISAAQVWVPHFLESGGGVQFAPIKESVKADENGNLQW